MRIAVVGSGISGMLAARLLHSRHEVTLFEAGGYAGGHANTVSVLAEGRRVDVDTGFMVFNRRTYPNFCKLLSLLGVGSRLSDMSFSVRCDRSGLEYQGSSLNGLFAQRKNLLNPRYYRMIAEIIRFNRCGTAAVERGGSDRSVTVEEFLKANSFNGLFVENYLIPMTAAIWSGRPESMLNFPAHFLLGFFHNHGLMQLKDRPQWQTVSGGSKEYVRRLIAPLEEQIRFSTPVENIRRHREEVELRTSQGVEFFDQVVLATHADQSLRLLEDASETEIRLLSTFPYQSNVAILHRDVDQLPHRSRAWASWNYRIPKQGNSGASVTYDLNRLQALGLRSPLLLTLNPVTDIPAASIIQQFQYHHPSYTLESLRAQQSRGLISGQKQRTHFCGAYWGFGFHEDGVNSALAVARDFGIDWETCIAASTRASLRTVVTCQ